MPNFEIITKYIGIFSDEEYGEWVIDREHSGTLDDPINIPHVCYSKIVNEFIEDVYSVVNAFNIKKYDQILENHGIDWEYESMKNANVDDLPFEVVLALILGAVRAERFCDGALLGFLREGHIKKWLCRLKRIDDAGINKIYLNDLLKIDFESAKNVKIKFNQHNGNEDPMEEYLNDPDIVNCGWLFWRNQQRYFNVGQIAICFLKLSDDTWLLTTIKKVTKELDVYDGINYIGEDVEQYRRYFGRVVVKYHKTAQTQGMYYNTVADQLEVLEILPNTYDGDEFPGYDKVRLSYMQLKSIIERRRKSWVAALENQKAVYLITDKNSGKLYVGSATAQKGMLLSRWTNYVNNGHGGNVELKRLVNEKGFEYVKNNFQYSILENYNSKTDDSYILKRESWWKETLQSRKFGYNDN